MTSKQCSEIDVLNMIMLEKVNIGGKTKIIHNRSVFKMINKIKSKINAFRWYLNNQQAGYVYQATSQELQGITKIYSQKQEGFE